MNQDSKSQRHFATKLGVVATTVGSAVGLGNIWRFPYEAGQHGGGAFLLVDLFFIFIVGVPVICAEFIIGHHTGSNIRGAFRKLAPGKPWSVVSYCGLLAALMILSFYSVVAGWTLEYVRMSLMDFSTGTSVGEFHSRFDGYAASGVWPVLWTLIFLIVNYLIISRGVQKGIEKMSNIMMPLMFVILLVFAVNSLMMPKAGEGLEFLFNPDFSKINSSVLLNGMGQAFFSLSLGLGCLITYSSYFKRETPLVPTAFTTAGLDTLVSVLAGVIIFPAVFTFGQEPAAGPKLVFEVLPSIFANLSFGALWSFLFFVLLFLASLSSTISMAEISVAYLVEEHRMGRKLATGITIGIAMVFGTLCALSFGPLSEFTIFGLSFFNLFDYVSSNILLPLGGMLISIFVGWVLDRSVVMGELTDGQGTKTRWTARCVVFCLKWFAPICIALVFIFGLGIF